MGDICDRAAGYTETDLKYNLDNLRRKIPAGDALLECEDCGAVIPAGRRKAVPGCRTCVSCQEEREAL